MLTVSRGRFTPQIPGTRTCGLCRSRLEPCGRDFRRFGWRKIPSGALGVSCCARTSDPTSFDGTRFRFCLSLSCWRHGDVPTSFLALLCNGVDDIRTSTRPNGMDGHSLHSKQRYAINPGHQQMPGVELRMIKVGRVQSRVTHVMCLESRTTCLLTSFPNLALAPLLSGTLIGLAPHTPTSAALATGPNSHQFCKGNELRVYPWNGEITQVWSQDLSLSMSMYPIPRCFSNAPCNHCCVIQIIQLWVTALGDHSYTISTSGCKEEWLGAGSPGRPHRMMGPSMSPGAYTTTC